MMFVLVGLFLLIPLIYSEPTCWNYELDDQVLLQIAGVKTYSCKIWDNEWLKFEKFTFQVEELDEDLESNTVFKIYGRYQDNNNDDQFDLLTTLSVKDTESLKFRSKVKNKYDGYQIEAECVSGTICNFDFSTDFTWKLSDKLLTITIVSGFLILLCCGCCCFFCIKGIRSSSSSRRRREDSLADSV